jgi:hypothetical protein
MGKLLVTPWLSDGTDTSTAVGFQPNNTLFAPITNDLGDSFSTFQSANDGTPAGHTIMAASGVYQRR